jgi:hypothetical protein
VIGRAENPKAKIAAHPIKVCNLYQWSCLFRLADDYAMCVPHKYVDIIFTENGDGYSPMM